MTTPTTKDVLVRAREYVARSWTQGEAARDAEGAYTSPDFPDAVCWCALGAIWRAQFDLSDDENDVWVGPDAEVLFTNLVSDEAEEVVPRWNDAPERTQADVLAMFDRAIEAADG